MKDFDKTHRNREPRTTVLFDSECQVFGKLQCSLRPGLVPDLIRVEFQAQEQAAATFTKEKVQSSVYE